MQYNIAFQRLTFNKTNESDKEGKEYNLMSLYC